MQRTSRLLCARFAAHQRRASLPQGEGGTRGSVIYSPLGRCRRSRQRGFLIYLLPCSKALSVRKSPRAVRTVEQNRYIENTPLGSPSGTALGKERLFFWLQKSGVNIKKCRRYNWSGDTTPPSFRLVYKPKIHLPLHRGGENARKTPRCEPYTGEPRSALQPLGANFTRGSRERLSSAAALRYAKFSLKMQNIITNLRLGVL